MSDTYELGRMFAMDEETEDELETLDDEELDEESFEDEDDEEVSPLVGTEDEEDL